MLIILCQEKRRASFEYGRYGNPTTVVLEEKIRFILNNYLLFIPFIFFLPCCLLIFVPSFSIFAELVAFLWNSALEGAESTLVMASGMCASTVLLLALVPAGGHMVTTTDCYRKTRIFMETFLPKMGIKVWGLIL